MQRPSPAKRERILNAAAGLFAARAFHEVRLDDVAAAAEVGKGTLYVYFRSKEELFDALLVEGFEQMLGRLRLVAADRQSRAWDILQRMVGELVGWAVSSPHFYQLIRQSSEHPPTPGLKEKRRELGRILEQVLVRGNRSGEFSDPHPELTAQFIPSCVRGAIRFGPAGAKAELITGQILRVIGGGIRSARGKPARPSTRRKAVHA